MPNKLDFLTKHWAPFPRRHPLGAPLISTDRLREKDHWIRRTFDTCNFSLILRGRGTYVMRGRRLDVAAPCVLTQWPHEPMEYGPVLPDDTWDELYLIYDGALMSRFKTVGLLDPERPVWAIRNPSEVLSQVAEFTALMRHPRPEFVADRVDRVAERMILETLLSPETPDTDDVIATIAGEVGSRLGEAVDFNALAGRHGLSPTTFRRRWSVAMNGQPPARYLQVLRMREACRLLVETSRPIHEIAGAVGFADEFYFSRRFRLEHGMPPRAYRHRYRMRAGSLPTR